MERFNDRNEYVKYLKDKFKNLEEEYNVFTHIITIFSEDRWWYKNKTDLEILDKKTFGILDQGLSLGLNSSFRYSAMNGTTVYIGNTKDLDVNEIVDYTYDQRHVKIRRVMVFAIPKYININGTKVEFSSYKGAADQRSATPEVLEEIKNGYDKNHVSLSYGSNHHTKFSLLDCTLSFEIPREYILGCQQVDVEKGEFSFLDNEAHVSHMAPEQREAFDQTKVDRILELGYNVEEDNRLDIFSTKTKRDSDALDSLYYDEI